MDLDSKDCDIVARLQANARVSCAELGRQVGLSTPAVIERMQKLEDAGVILGYHAQINPAAVGLPVHAIVRITVDGGRIQGFAELARRTPEVLRCHRITGPESYLVEVSVRDTQHLEEVIDALMPYVATNTSLVLGSAFAWKPITPAQALPRRGGRKKTRL
jgi:Lrp/AsnC family transcriptional regulator, leucine-responsive regulatory protein